MMDAEAERVARMLVRCRYEWDLKERAFLLRKINESLPSTKQLRLSKSMTDEYVSKALDTLEKRLFGTPIYS